MSYFYVELHHEPLVWNLLRTLHAQAADVIHFLKSNTEEEESALLVCSAVHLGVPGFVRLSLHREERNHVLPEFLSIPTHLVAYIEESRVRHPVGFVPAPIRGEGPTA